MRTKIQDHHCHLYTRTSMLLHLLLLLIIVTIIMVTKGSPVHKDILAPLSTMTWQMLPPANVLDVTWEPEK